MKKTVNKVSLILLTGVAGSGKSTWIHKHVDLFRNPIIVSRDAIRFAMLMDGDDYFAHEKLVFKTFCERIQLAIDSNNHGAVIADATFLNETSRTKLLDKLKLSEEVRIIVINFLVNEEVCLERNRTRTGRAFVPENIILDMCKRYEPATYEEKYTYTYIMEVDDNGYIYSA